MADSPNSPTMAKAPVSQEEMLRTEYALFGATTVVVLARVVVHFLRRRTVELQDFFIYFAYALYVALWTEYIISVPYLYTLTAVATGQIPPYPNVVKDAAYMSRLIFTAQMCFYLCLWSVKMSFLTLYRKLLTGLGGIYNKIWWGIVAFAALAYTGCIISSIKSCNSLRIFFKTGSCASPEEIENQIISLYYSYAIDVLTDLMVMFLPIRLVWGLQMDRTEKTGILILFCGGFVCIAFATLRAVKVGIKHGKPVSPDTKWLTLWTVIEMSMAIIVGCSPAFAYIIRRRISPKKISDKGHAYQKQNGEEDKLRTIGSAGRQRPNDNEATVDSVYEEETPVRVELQRNPIYNPRAGKKKQNQGPTDRKME